MDGFLARAARFAAVHWVEGLAGAAIALSAPAAFAAFVSLGGLAEERFGGLLMACVASFLAGLAVGLAADVPKRVERARAERDEASALFLSLGPMERKALVTAYDKKGGPGTMITSGEFRSNFPGLSELAHVADVPGVGSYFRLTRMGVAAIRSNPELVEAIRESKPSLVF
ncbi:MAG: hypothetical protein SOW20_01485 [Berryella intestinalis]|uniref:hypothetical protein n=1 Tax=Berryella intestinalis TaxID=1531429 RepID=UPI002A74A004|nr:hypothetical protein [Berryella intestinalis]MDY3128686.1 hypothetical protein [Berryella intestinalis]